MTTENPGYTPQFQKRDWEAILVGDNRLNTIAIAIKEWRKEKGFETPDMPDSRMLGKLMLVVSEVAEAAEACRDEDFSNFAEEIADTFIRLFDICATVGIDIESVIYSKMQRNEARPHKHGRKSAV